MVYANDELEIRRYRRFSEPDAELGAIRSSWDRELRQAIRSLPEIAFDPQPPDRQLGITHTFPRGG